MLTDQRRDEIRERLAAMALELSDLVEKDLVPSDEPIDCVADGMLQVSARGLVEARKILASVPRTTEAAPPAMGNA